MTSAVDGLKQRFMEMSRADGDGVYRDGAAKRKARTDLAMACLRDLWDEACEAVAFDVPKTGVGLGRWDRWLAGRWARARISTWCSSTTTRR